MKGDMEMNKKIILIICLSSLCLGGVALTLLILTTLGKYEMNGMTLQVLTYGGLVVQAVLVISVVMYLLDKRRQ